MVQSENAEKHKKAVDQLKRYFKILPNKDQAWQDLHCLTQDDNSIVRRGAASALGSVFHSIPDTHKDQAWQDLHRLTQDDDSIVRIYAADALGSVFHSIPDAYEDQAWQDLHRLTQDDDILVRRGAASALGSVFRSIPDTHKDQAWQDLHRLTQDDESDVRRYAADALSSASAYSSIPDVHKDQAWQDLIRLTRDDDNSDAAFTLDFAFISISDASKDQACQDLICLTQNDESDVRAYVASALGSAFISIPDAHKDQACQNLHRLTQDDESDVRMRAASALGSAFISIPDAYKDQAWQDLHHLTQDDESDVRRYAADALGSAFNSIPDAHKDQAWHDLHRLTQDDDSRVRVGAAGALGSAFISIPDAHKDQAWHDLHRLTQDDDSRVRRGAASALGSAFISIPDAHKDQAWHDLHRLTQDDDIDVRVSANYSLGRVSILKATDAANENEFKSELKNALEFFEKSTAKATYINPARFCHPFYKSIFSITFEEPNVEAKVQEYIKEAKNAIEGSESKKILLEAVENLENALREVQKSREKGLDAWKHDLKAYRRYCDRACDLLDSTKENAPGATRIIRRRMPIIDQCIKEIIAEIHEKAEALYIQTRDTPFEDLGKEVCRTGQSLVKTKDPARLEKKLDDLQFILSSICDKMPEYEKKELNRQLEKVNSEVYIEDRFDSINMIISKISSQISVQSDMEKLEKKLDTIMVSIKPGISENLVITVGAGFLGTGVQHVITVPLQEINYSDLEEDLKSIKGNTVSKLTSLPKKLAEKIKDYLIQNKKDDLLKELE